VVNDYKSPSPCRRSSDSGPVEINSSPSNRGAWAAVSGCFHVISTPLEIQNSANLQVSREQGNRSNRTWLGCGLRRGKPVIEVCQELGEPRYAQCISSCPLVGQDPEPVAEKNLARNNSGRSTLPQPETIAPPFPPTPRHPTCITQETPL
jgi:hypothetical protein